MLRREVLLLRVEEGGMLRREVLLPLGEWETCSTERLHSLGRMVYMPPSLPTMVLPDIPPCTYLHPPGYTEQSLSFTAAVCTPSMPDVGLPR